MEFFLKRKRESDSPVHDQERPQKNVRTDDEGATCSQIQIAELLDLTPCETHSDISRRFDEIADALFFDFRLSVNCGGTQTEFDILEIEFYLKKPVCHDDPFTHATELQGKSGLWYFHGAPHYRSGTRKGIDLTFGGPVGSSEKSRVRGGILFRTIRRVSNSEVTSGPSLLVDEILRVSEVSGIPELVEHKWNRDLSALPAASSSTDNSSSSTFLRLQRKDRIISTKKPPVYCSPRIGLDLSHPSTKNSPSDPRVVFLSKPYRYFIHPDLLVSKGRSHTFIGVYRACRDSGKNAKNEHGLLRDVIRLMKLAEKSAVKYLKDYKDGLDNGNLKSFVGVAGASSSVSSCLKMMGTLERVQAAELSLEPELRK